MELTQYIFEFLKEFNFQTILSTFAIVWYFHKETQKKFDKIDKKFDKVDEKFDKMDDKMDDKFDKIDKKFDKIDEKMDEKFDKVDEKFDKVNDNLHDLDRRLCRIEGALSSKECCMLKDDRQLKRAE